MFWNTLYLCSWSSDTTWFNSFTTETIQKSHHYCSFICSRYCDCFPVYSKSIYHHNYCLIRCFLRYMYIVILTQVALIRISCTIVSSWIICQIIYFLSVYWCMCALLCSLCVWLSVFGRRYITKKAIQGHMTTSPSLFQANLLLVTLYDRCQESNREQTAYTWQESSGLVSCTCVAALDSLLWYLY